VEIRIRRSRLEDAPTFSAAVKAVASEKWYLATIDGYSVDETRAYIQRALDGAVCQVVAIADDRVVGACDVQRVELKGLSHVGQLGMFVLKDFRGQGIGKKLLIACLAVAKEAALEKVELQVFADNLPAISLYESSGFQREGCKVRSRKWEGRYQDVVMMALWL
jgi:RimJ/RimL family protein N-acetyltransferase